MRWLVRFYPAAWRERYGDEMEALLEERPLGPFDMFDLFLGALDAHLHLRGPGHAAKHEKGFTMSLRIAGFAAIVGGLLWALFWFIDVYVQTADRQEEFPARLFLAIPAIALFIALAGLSAFQSRAHGTEIWTSFGIAAVGLGLLIVGWGIVPLVAGVPAWGIGFVGGLGLLAGSLLFARVTYSTGALSRGAALLLGVGAIAHLIAIGAAIVLGGAPAGYLMLGLGAAMFAVGWIGLGVDAVRRDRSTMSAHSAGA